MQPTRQAVTNVTRARRGPQFTHHSLAIVALDQVTAAGVLVAWLSTGAELTAHEAGRLVSGRSPDEWRVLEKRRRSRFTAKASTMLRCMSGRVAIYDSLELRDGVQVRVWRFVGLAADLEYMRTLPEEDE